MKCEINVAWYRQQMKSFIQNRPLKSKIQHIISVRTKSREIMSILWWKNNVLGSIIRNATLLLTQTQCILKWRRYMNELCHLLCILIWKSVWLNVWSTNLNKWVSFNTVMCILVFNYSKKCFGVSYTKKRHSIY